MFKNFKMLAVPSVLILTLGLTACGDDASTESDENNGEEEININLSTPDPNSASISVVSEQFADLVQEKSNGSIEVNVHPDGTLYGGDPSAAINQLGEGSLDMVALSTSLYANFEPAFNVISLPFLFDDQDQYVEFLNSDHGDYLLNSLDSLNIEGLGYWTRNFRQITNSQQPINSVSDLEGVELRVPNNPLWVDFFEEAGGITTPMDFSEVYNALQLNTIDGQENPVEIPRNSSFYEVQDYLSLTNHMADGWVLGINQELYNDLSDENQQILDEATTEMQEWGLNYDNEQEKENIDYLDEQGMEVNELSQDEEGEFVSFAEELYPSFREVIEDDDYFNDVLDFVGKNNQ